MIHSRFWQAFFALAPLVVCLVALCSYFVFLISLLSGHQEQADVENISFSIVMPGLGIFLLLIFLAVLLSIGSLVFYIVHAAQNPNLKQNNMLVVWILLFVFASGIGQLIYWILEILNKPKIRN